MSILSINIPHFYCLLRKEYLYDLSSHHSEYIPCCVFGVTSIPSRSIMFTTMLNNGSQVARLPISAFCWKECDPQPLEVLELWDNFSYSISCVEYDYLKGLRVSSFLKDKNWYEGEYMFTLDWYGSNAAEEPGEGGFKTAHILKLDNGNFAAQPNNRTIIHEPSNNPKELKFPDFRVSTKKWSVESESKWSLGDTNTVMYFKDGEDKE